MLSRLFKCHCCNEEKLNISSMTGWLLLINARSMCCHNPNLNNGILIPISHAAVVVYKMQMIWCWFTFLDTDTKVLHYLQRSVTKPTHSCWEARGKRSEAMSVLPTSRCSSILQIIAAFAAISPRGKEVSYYSVCSVRWSCEILLQNVKEKLIRLLIRNNNLPIS